MIRLIRADETLLATGSYVIELTPPLYFLLAWVSAQVGDASEAIRVPAVIAGILTVPLVYLVGLRTVGPTSALFATALAAAQILALIYQSGNARAYGLAAFLVMLTTLAFLKALEDARLRWWIASRGGKRRGHLQAQPITRRPSSSPSSLPGDWCSIAGTTRPSSSGRTSAPRSLSFPGWASSWTTARRLTT